MSGRSRALPLSLPPLPNPSPARGEGLSRRGARRVVEMAALNSVISYFDSLPH